MWGKFAGPNVSGAMKPEKVFYKESWCSCSFSSWDTGDIETARCVLPDDTTFACSTFVQNTFENIWKSKVFTLDGSTAEPFKSPQYLLQDTLFIQYSLKTDKNAQIYLQILGLYSKFYSLQIASHNWNLYQMKFCRTTR